jgi:hypothetical protein
VLRRASYFFILFCLIFSLGTQKGLAPETVENSIQQLNSMSARCNNPEIAGKLQRTAVR